MAKPVARVPGATNTRDARTRSFNIKLMLRTLPVANRQWAWYPTAYPELAMRQCPVPGCDAIESQGHMFMCPAHSWKTHESSDFDPGLGSRIAAIATAVSNACSAYLLLTDVILGRMMQAADDELTRTRLGMLVNELQECHARTPTLFVREIAAKKYDWNKYRCALQVDKEEQGSIHPEQRRKLMKQQWARRGPNPRVNEDDRLPHWPRTTKNRRDDISKSYHATINNPLLGAAARAL
ncbi:hypothetical protein LPJ61_004449 [Coemansia biformis]|uniref:Uncharacterized protein n=1 Tax=Coemansia biformis TaxID=1286918 RepID=A0A9W8CXL3_9FUNG|nr:hypothetical protein LPJ61_004449 [Coemansia biformis]